MGKDSVQDVQVHGMPVQTKSRRLHELGGNPVEGFRPLEHPCSARETIHGTALVAQRKSTSLLKKVSPVRFRLRARVPPPVGHVFVRLRTKPHVNRWPGASRRLVYFAPIAQRKSSGLS